MKIIPKNQKRVIQISLDIVVNPDQDGDRVSDHIADELIRCGYMVVGAGFQEDMTECYEEQYPELLNTNKLS